MFDTLFERLLQALQLVLLCGAVLTSVRLAVAGLLGGDPGAVLGWQVGLLAVSAGSYFLLSYLRTRGEG
jgi:hypothetical protein